MRSLIIVKLSGNLRLYLSACSIVDILSCVRIDIAKKNVKIAYSYSRSRGRRPSLGFFSNSYAFPGRMPEITLSTFNIFLKLLQETLKYNIFSSIKMSKFIFSSNAKGCKQLFACSSII